MDEIPQHLLEPNRPKQITMHKRLYLLQIVTNYLNKDQ